jgi:ATP-dependent Clp protease ATP-binding subunit ClpX
MDTTDILFIASGAFTGLDKLISRRLDKQMLGFGQKAPVNAITKDDKDPQVLNQKRDNLLKQVQAEDMIEFGMIQELVC